MRTEAIYIFQGAPPHPAIPAFAVTVTLAEKLWLVFFCTFVTWREPSDIEKKKIIKDHLVLKDDVLHT